MVNVSTGFRIEVPTMIFIDGGYLRKWLKDECNVNIERFNLATFATDIAKFFNWRIRDHIIRTYFYDGIVDHNQPEYAKQKGFHNYINSEIANCEVREGRLIKDGKGKSRQKGVDTLLAIDMIDKANSNQFDVAIVVAGDLDHLEAVRTTKNKGKSVFGVFDPKTASKDLTTEFDRGHILKKEEWDTNLDEFEGNEWE